MKQANENQSSSNRPKNGTMLDISLKDYIKSKGGKTVAKLDGPNGAFISWSDGQTRHTIPVGRNSQDGQLADFKLIQTEPDENGNSVVIATVNNYEVVEEMTID